MRPINTAARDRLAAELRRNPPKAAAVLAARLDISTPTLLRMVRERPNEIFRLGSTKNARYALRRSLRGQIEPIPIFRIDANGRGHEAGRLEFAAPAGAFLDLADWGWPPPDDDNPRGWWDGLPYRLYDMQPQGFLGRKFAQLTQTTLNVSSNPKEWSDGDVILGDVAYQKWLSSIAANEPALPPDTLAEAYPQLVSAAISGGIAGSSAAGEFPKFTAMRELAGANTLHVIVKFSGADNSVAVQRWSDLLICEQLALDTQGESTGLATARSRIIQGAGRTLLESERFDRIGQFGRKSQITLASLHAALLGSPPASWPEIAGKITLWKWLTSTDEQRIGILWWYGKLIANTDMHLGNLSFHIRNTDTSQTPLELSPAYDILPMRYAPLPGGEVPADANFSPPLPLPKDRELWLVACRAALHFWQRAAADQRVSPQFREICQANELCLAIIAERV